MPIGDKARNRLQIQEQEKALARAKRRDVLLKKAQINYEKQIETIKENTK